MIEAFSVAIAIRLNDYTNRALRDMVHNFAATEAQAAKLQKTINSIQSNAMKGFLMLGAGAGLFSMFDKPLEAANKATAHLYIANPLKGQKLWMASLFSTHPDINERISRLRGMKY